MFIVFDITTPIPAVSPEESETSIIYWLVSVDALDGLIAYIPFIFTWNPEFSAEVVVDIVTVFPETENVEPDKLDVADVADMEEKEEGNVIVTDPSVGIPDDAVNIMLLSLVWDTMLFDIISSIGVSLAAYTLNRIGIAIKNITRNIAKDIFFIYLLYYSSLYCQIFYFILIWSYV